MAFFNLRYIAIMIDYLIVGFGISGLSIQRQLDQSNLSFRVISNQSQTASLTAGGLINPLMLNTGKPVWNIDSFLPFAIDFYSSFSEEFYNSYPIHKVFNSVQEQNQYLSTCNHTNHNYTSGSIISTYNNISAPYKMSKITGGGVVDIQSLLYKQKHYLINSNNLIEDTFSFNQLTIHSQFCSYMGEQFRHVIFTNGFGNHSNPFFNALPIEGIKGEYIIIESKELQLEAILKNKYFLIPMRNHLYKYGATYSRGKCDNLPSKEAKIELVNNLNTLLKCPYQIKDQVAGVRPTVKDKKPIYGSHPTYKNIHILNGMGSRGLLMAPLLAKELIFHIEYGIPLKDQISVQRFQSYFN